MYRITRVLSLGRFATPERARDLLAAGVTHVLNVSDGCSEGRTLVVDDGRLVGIISPSDINRMLQRSLAGTSA